MMSLCNAVFVVSQGIRRTSNLLAPIMQLVGHGGDVLGMSFSPDGSSVASCSFDRTILLWRTYDECENYMMLRGHKNAVTQVRPFLLALEQQQLMTHPATAEACASDSTDAHAQRCTTCL